MTEGTNRFPFFIAPKPERIFFPFFKFYFIQRNSRIISPGIFREGYKVDEGIYLFDILYYGKQKENVNPGDIG